MDIFKFIKKLLPRVDRATVAEDLRLTEKELVNMVLPSWEAAAAHFKLNKPNSAEHDTLNQLFYQNFQVKGIKPKTFVELIQKLLPDLHKNVLFLQTTLDENFQKDILPEGLTARGAYILRAAGNISVMTRYLLSLLNYLYTVEAQHNEVHLDPNLTLAKAELKYVETNFPRFVKLLAQYAIPNDAFRKQIGELPDIFVNNASAVTTGFFSGSVDKILSDPGVVGFTNPIYLLRLPIARWQNDRYESSKNKKQQLELRLLYLQMQRDEAQDPSVAKEIEQLQTRIDSLEKHLREVEDSVGA